MEVVVVAVAVAMVVVVVVIVVAVVIVVVVDCLVPAYGCMPIMLGHTVHPYRDTNDTTHHPGPNAIVKQI